MADTDTVNRANLAGELRTIPCERIRILPGHNARADVGDIAELAASIRALGVLQALTVVELGDEDGQPMYGLIAGERRLTAARQVGLADVPCVVRRGLDERQRVAAMLVENLQRQDLAPLEEAEGLSRLAGLGMSQREIAAQLGCSQSHVSKRLALLGLPEEIRAAIDQPRDAGGITVVEALELTRLPHQSKAQLQAFGDGRRGYGGVAGAVRLQLEALERERERAEARARLQSQGVKVLKERDYYDWYSSGGPRPLLGGRYTHNALQMTPEQHQGQPCHAAAIERDGEVVLVCTQPSRHADVDPRMTSRGEQQRRQQEESRLRREAAHARREVMGRVLAAANTSQLTFAARQVLESWRVSETRLACELLGLEARPTRYGAPAYNEALAEHAAASMGAAIRALVALALATGEDRVASPYGGVSGVSKRHVELLVAAGYEPNESDRTQLTGEPDAQPADDFRECRVCGCTDEEGCEGGCEWVEDPEDEGDLCSACLPGVVAAATAGPAS